MMLPVPAPGFTTISGKRRPPKTMGTHLHCQLRNGTVDPYGEPWPVAEVRWVHDGTNGDVVAVKRAGESHG